MARIFVSYNQADGREAINILDYLNAAYGYEAIFYDSQQPGSPGWHQTLQREITACTVFIFMVSDASLTSHYCQQELREALRLHKPIIALTIAPLQRHPSQVLDGILADGLWNATQVDLSTGLHDWPGPMPLEAVLERYLPKADSGHPHPDTPVFSSDWPHPDTPVFSSDWPHPDTPVLSSDWPHPDTPVFSSDWPHPDTQHLSRGFLNEHLEQSSGSAGGTGPAPYQAQFDYDDGGSQGGGGYAQQQSQPYAVQPVTRWHWGWTLLLGLFGAALFFSVIAIVVHFSNPQAALLGPASVAAQTAPTASPIFNPLQSVTTAPTFRIRAWPITLNSVDPQAILRHCTAHGFDVATLSEIERASHAGVIHMVAGERILVKRVIGDDTTVSVAAVGLNGRVDILVEDWAEANVGFYCVQR